MLGIVFNWEFCIFCARDTAGLAVIQSLTWKYIVDQVTTSIAQRWDRAGYRTTQGIALSSNSLFLYRMVSWISPRSISTPCYIFNSRETVCTPAACRCHDPRIKYSCLTLLTSNVNTAIAPPRHHVYLICHFHPHFFIPVSSVYTKTTLCAAYGDLSRIFVSSDYLILSIDEPLPVPHMAPRKPVRIRNKF